MKRLRNKLVLFFLVSGSLTAMDDPGFWDEFGNYLGPTFGGSVVYLPFYKPDNGSAAFPLFSATVMPIVQPAANRVADRVEATTLNNNDELPASSAVATSASSQEAHQLWAEADDDDEPSLPKDWVQRASSSSSAAAPQPVPLKKQPPRLDTRSSHPDAKQMSRQVDNAVMHAGAESADWRKRPLFDDRLALAAQKGRDSRQQFIGLLSRKVYWLAGRCREKKIANESERLIYILEQNVSDFSMRPQDVQCLVSLAKQCINYGVRRALQQESKQGFAHVANKLLSLTVASVDDSREIQELYNQTERILGRQ